MFNCPRCDRTINAEQVSCPHCGYELKAFGHPGMPLYHAPEKSFLCPNCIYHQDDTCTFPQRPYAKTCTLYQDINKPPEAELARAVYRTDSLSQTIKNWCWRNRWLVILLIIFVISIFMTLR
ncbi:MAG: zinc ribbon domain-containing protein [Spirulinaceae cyanobacterium]